MSPINQFHSLLEILYNFMDGCKYGWNSSRSADIKSASKANSKGVPVYFLRRQNHKISRLSSSPTVIIMMTTTRTADNEVEARRLVEGSR